MRGQSFSLFLSRVGARAYKIQAMSDVPRVVSSSLSPTAYIKPLAAPTKNGDEFQSLLNALNASMAQNMMAALPLPSAGNVPNNPLAGFGGGESSAVEPLLMLMMMQLLERVMGQLGQAPSPAAPQGLPVTGPISQEFHAGHRAMDIAVPVGTPVRATMAGRVAFSGWSEEGYGNLVILDNGPYRTYYAHLEQLPLAEGAVVAAGEVIGFSGNTGNSTGPHVHYEVRLNGELQPPV